MAMSTVELADERPRSPARFVDQRFRRLTMRHVFGRKHRSGWLVVGLWAGVAGLVASSSHAAQATERVDRDFLTPVGAAQHR